MNRNALTEQRRETVIGLLKGMNIKKSTVGGFDRDDVYECMQQLCDLYEKNIEDLENAYEAEISGLKERYQKYDDNNELYVSLIMEAKKSSNEIINQAKTEVETILSEGREEVAKQEKELEQMRIGTEAEKKAMTDELNAARAAVEAEKAAMKAEVDAEREKVTTMKNKYSQQLNSMEEEFEEIRINVLRIAGKIDSLKSKLPTDEEIQWNVMDEVNNVDFPAMEIEVESAEPELHIDDVIQTEELPVAEPAVEEPVEEAFTLEDLIPSEEVVLSDEISLEGIELELPELNEEPAAEPAAEEGPVEEISFEGLEDLFKDEN